LVNITVTCYLWAPSTGDHLFTCGAIFRPPQHRYSPVTFLIYLFMSRHEVNCMNTHTAERWSINTDKTECNTR